MFFFYLISPFWLVAIGGDEDAIRPEF